MKRAPVSCCVKKGRNIPDDQEMDIPGEIQKELDQIGGFSALADHIPPPGELEEKSRTYHALSDPIRLTILHLLRGQPLCVCIINRFMRLPGPKLSYHLTILKESGLIVGEYHGKWIIYSLTEQGRMSLV